ncbi:MAG: sigma 54-interacting transcriptional regulator [Gemmatimonadales bacterium]|nr:sigma 54-interacting transcriptional regulator [Gemmatimonadales bacterium]
MRDNFKDHRRFVTDLSGASGSLNTEDWVRLEEVGDLHFHASSYSSALDYFGQLLDERILDQMVSDQALRVLRKAIDSWILLGNLEAAEELVDRAESLLADDPDCGAHLQTTIVGAVIKSRRALILRERGHHHESLNLFKKAFSILALSDEHAEVARLQTGMGLCHMRLGNLEKAEEFYADGLSTFRRIGHDLGVANILNNLSILHKNRCSWSKSLSLAEQAVGLAQKIGASHLMPLLYINMGLALLKTDRIGEAQTTLNRGLRIAKSLGDRLSCTRLYLALGRAETQAGRLARSEELILEGQALAIQNRFFRESVIADEFLGDIQLARGDVDKARFNYGLGLEKNLDIGLGNDLEGELLRRMGQAHLQAGNWVEAVAVSQAAIGVCEQCSELFELGFCHLTLGGAYAAQKDYRQSDSHFREAIATFQSQELPHLWCRAIIEFSDSRLESAGERELLLLRRYLMDAQEDGAAAVSDQVLCQILQRLAMVQIRLNQFDDALLTVFELERHAAGFEDYDLDRSVVRLRNQIESGFVGGTRLVESNLQAFCSIPGLFQGADDSNSTNLGSILSFGMERVEADSGYIAMADNGAPDQDLRIVAKKGMTANLGHQLIHWFGNRAESGAKDATCFFSRLDAEGDLTLKVPALKTVAESCVFMPIASQGRVFGLLFLGKSESRLSSPGFDRASLDFLGAYMGFLALLLFEKNQRANNLLPVESISRVENFESIITRNQKMLEVLELARKVAPSDLTVLLNGQTGTGKGLLAKSIHALSPRAGHKLMAINCAAIPEALLESELFGHVKGSFTGAHSDKKGLLAEAEGGTVFLDEVGKMSLGMQGKMLHFLDTRMVRPVGSNSEFKVDVRIICASKLDLSVMGQKGSFLEDLYYRMLDFPLTLPPLCDRPDDVPLLVRHFVARFCRDLGMEMLSLDAAFMNALLGYPWPGNVRELEKNLKRAIILAQGEGVLRLEHLPESITGSVSGQVAGGEQAPLRETMAGVECVEIERALTRSGWNKSQAARTLKISYPNLLKKIRHYGLRTS